MSKVSGISKAASNFSKGRFEKRLDEEVTKADSAMEKVSEKPAEEEVAELEYQSDPEKYADDQDLEEYEGDELSQAPTEILAREYKLLLAQYDQERDLRKNLESEIAALKSPEKEPVQEEAE